MVSDDRGQAFTLEALIGSILILTAVLFALQSIVITPTTAGTIDRDVAEQRVGQAEDALQIAASEDELSHMVRYFNESNDEPFPAGADENGYSREEGIPPAVAGRFGALLNEAFVGQQYNVEVIPLEEDGNRDADNATNFFSQGDPTNQAVSASVTVTLYDDQLLTAPGARDITLEEAESEGVELPYENVDPNSEVYNVVEVRITVW